MTRRSAGILAYRVKGKIVEVLLVHPGGPFWSKRDLGAWSVPKGEYSDDEAPEIAARREFSEETGWVPNGRLFPLGEIRQRNGKVVVAFAMEGDFSVVDLSSNMFEIEWPPRSNRTQSFPEVDRAEWFTLPQANAKIIPAQCPFLDRLEVLIAGKGEH